MPSPPTGTSPHHVLMVAPTSFFADYGCHVRILEEARVLQKLGLRITIVTYYKGRDLPDLEIVRTRPVPWREEYEVGSSRRIHAKCRLDTPVELEYYRNSGILHTVLRRMLRSS